MKTARQQGFSLIELLLVLGITIFVGAIALNEIKQQNDSNQAHAAGEQIALVGDALNSYIALRYEALITSVPVSDDVAGDASDNPADPGPRSCVTATIDGLSGKRCSITSETLRRNGLVPNSFSGRNAWGAEYSYQIVVTGTAPNFVIDGMVATTTPFLSGTTIRYDLLGAAMMVAGADSGATRELATRANGYGGSWAEERFTNLDQLGLLVYRAGYAASAYGVYLRRDGSVPMTGDLDMDGHSITGVGDLEATGTVSGGRLNAKDQVANALTFGDDSAPTGSIGTFDDAGTPGLTIRSNGKVSLDSVDGSTKATLDTGQVNATGVNASGGIISQGTLAVSGNASFASDVQANGTITANGNITSRGQVTAGTSVKVGTATLSSGVLVLDNSGGSSRGLAFDAGSNTIQLLNSSNLYTAGNVRANTGSIDQALTVGARITLEAGSNPAVGDSCSNSTTATRVARSATGEVVQCVSGRWLSMGVNQTVTAASSTSSCSSDGAVSYAVASCPAGTVLTGGGFDITSGPGRAAPVRSYANGNSWLVLAPVLNPYLGTGATEPTCFSARAVCVR